MALITKKVGSVWYANHESGNSDITGLGNNRRAVIRDYNRQYNKMYYRNKIHYFNMRKCLTNKDRAKFYTLYDMIWE